MKCMLVYAVLGVGMNAVPGGYFPLPSEVAHLMSRIPPPHCFNVSVSIVAANSVIMYTMLISPVSLLMCQWIFSAVICVLQYHVNC